MDKQLFTIDAMGAALFTVAAFVVMAMLGSPRLALLGLVAGVVGFLASLLVTSGRLDPRRGGGAAVFVCGLMAIVSVSALVVGLAFEVLAP